MSSQTVRGGDSSRPGTPSLLRELNDRAALRLLLDGRPLTRSQLSELTGVSKVTVAQMLARLEERGLVAAAGEQAGGRGPNAALYSVVPSSAYVAGMYAELGTVSTAVADVTGKVIAEVKEDTAGAAAPLGLIRSAVDRVCSQAGISVDQLSAFVIGGPGVVDPRTGDATFTFNLPEWHEGMLDALRDALRKPVTIENDVNLAAIAERAAVGAAAGADDFVLLWMGIGLGLATMIGGRLHRGVSGAAGEIGWLPVSGAPVTSDVRLPARGGLQSLVGADSVQQLALRYGFGDGGATKSGAARSGAADSVRAAVAALAGDLLPPAGAGAPAVETPAVETPAAGIPAAGAAEPGPEAPGSPEAAAAFLDELARRVALGATAVCTVLDPGLVVLGGEIGLAGGTLLAERVAEQVAGMCLVRPRVVATAVSSEPVLRGALLLAVDRARADLLASV